MTITKWVTINCDSAGPDCAWYDEPIHGESNQTATQLLREAGWVTKDGDHICPQCQKNPGTGVNEHGSPRMKGAGR